MAMMSTTLLTWEQDMALAIAAVAAASTPEDLEAARLAEDELAIRFKAAHNAAAYVDEYLANADKPTILGTSPNDGQINVTVGTAIRVNFSEPMDVATLVPSTFLYSINGGAYTAFNTVSVDATGMIATLGISGGLQAGAKTYKIRVLVAAKDEAGHAMAAQFNHSLGFVTHA